jgi:cyclopropane-fatty-acyl-phospholipid synthase
MGAGRNTVASTIEPMLRAVLRGPSPIPLECWDGSSIDGTGGPGRLILRSPNALRHIAWAPGELGIARAFVEGDIDVEGPLPEMLRSMQAALPDSIGVGVRALPSMVAAAHELGALGAPLPAPPEEIVPHGRRHSIRRDKQAVSHHYDAGNEFYELVLGPAMTYSCARFEDADMSLEDAQRSKHDLVCRKLGLADAEFRRSCVGERPRLLDIGCGWGSMAIHAASTYDVDVVGVTLSREQADHARRHIAELGLDDRVEIRIQDYREVSDGPVDAISSIGMAEHVGRRQMDTYFSALYRLLRPAGRVVNHAIASKGGSRMRRSSFVGRYVFPDGELLDLGDTVLSMHRCGFEVRDVENLREHYAQTLRCWVANLEANWDRSVELVGERRARVWRLYMAGSVNGFVDAGLQLYQTLGVKNTDDGRSAMPATRAAWM